MLKSLASTWTPVTIRIIKYVHICSLSYFPPSSYEMGENKISITENLHDTNCYCALIDEWSRRFNKIKNRKKEKFVQGRVGTLVLQISYLCPIPINSHYPPNAKSSMIPPQAPCPVKLERGIAQSSPVLHRRHWRDQPIPFRSVPFP